MTGHRHQHRPVRWRAAYAALSGPLTLTTAACGLTTPAGGAGITGAATTSAIAAPARPLTGLDGPWRVVSVSDGDTIRVTRTGDGGGGAVVVRLVGVDAQETVDPRKGVQCYGREASAALKQILTGTTVDLEYGNERLDKYGRTLASVWRGPELINYRIVLSGYAREYTYNPAQPSPHADALRAAQADARVSGRGLWAPAGCNGSTEVRPQVPRR